MTIAQIRKLLRETLKRYNCADWSVQIGLAYLDEGIEDEHGEIIWRHSGVCKSIWRYKQAQIQIGDHIMDKEIPYIVRHEAAHVLLGEMHDVFERLMGMIPEEHQQTAYDIFMDAEEHTCDRLAMAPFHKETQ